MKKKIASRFSSEALSLEAGLSYESYRAYINYPVLHSNSDVLRMLNEVDRNNEPKEDEATAAEEAAYERGEKEGWDCCQDNELKPLVEKCNALLFCLQAPPRSALRKEIPEATAELMELVRDIERRLKL